MPVAAERRRKVSWKALLRCKRLWMPAISTGLRVLAEAYNVLAEVYV